MVTSFNLLFFLCFLLVIAISSSAKMWSTPNRLQRLMRSSSSKTKTSSVDTARLVPTSVIGSHILELRGGADDRRSPSQKFLNWVVSTLRRALRFLGVHSSPSRSFNSSGGKTTAKKKTKKTKSTRSSENAAVKAPVPKKSERIVAAKRPLPASSVAGGSSLARIQRVSSSPLPTVMCLADASMSLIHVGAAELFGEPAIKLRGDGGRGKPSALDGVADGAARHGVRRRDVQAAYRLRGGLSIEAPCRVFPAASSAAQTCLFQRRHLSEPVGQRLATHHDRGGPGGVHFVDALLCEGEGDAARQRRPRRSRPGPAPGLPVPRRQVLKRRCN